MLVHTWETCINKFNFHYITQWWIFKWWIKPHSGSCLVSLICAVYNIQTGILFEWQLSRIYFENIRIQKTLPGEISSIIFYEELCLIGWKYVSMPFLARNGIDTYLQPIKHTPSGFRIEVIHFIVLPTDVNLGIEQNFVWKGAKLPNGPGKYNYHICFIPVRFFTPWNVMFVCLTNLQPHRVSSKPDAV